MQADGADVLLGRLFESNRPLPLVAALDGRERNVTIVGKSAVGGVRPRNDGVEMLDDLPLGKEQLGCCASESWRGRKRRRGVWSSTAGMLVDMGGTITAEGRWVFGVGSSAANEIESDASQQNC